MELPLLFVEVDQAHQDVRDELRDDHFGDEWAKLTILFGLEMLFNGDYSVDAATVHVFHHQIDHTVMEKDTVILYLKEVKLSQNFLSMVKFFLV